MEKKELIRQIEKELSYDQVEPIKLSPSMQKELEAEGDAFRELYEEELLACYEEFKEEQ